ncbi:MAG: DUF6798 domain-containing protein [Cytophagaceae bacterium]
MKLLNGDWQRDLVFGIFMWAILVFFLGYQIGTGDNIEFLPFVLFLNNAELFPHDFFIQSMESMGINERFFFTRLLSFFYPYQETVSLLIHMLATLLMVIGMLRISRRYLENTYSQYAVVLLALLVTYGINAGGNELYYNNLQGATLAKALSVWAICYFLDDRILRSTLLLIIATLFQPLVGLHLFLLMIPVGIYQAFVINRIPYLELVLSLFFYTFTAGIYIWGIMAAQGTGQAHLISDSEFIDIAYYFRLPHHYIPTYFSKKGIVLMGIFSLCAIFFFKKKDPRMLIFFFTLYIGIIIYLGGLFQDHFTIVSSWWFRTMIWVKLLGAIAFIGLLEKYIPISRIPQNRGMEMTFLAALAFIMGIIFTVFPRALPAKNQYHFSSDAIHKYPDLDIAVQIREKTPVNALFIQPFEFTALKYYGRRSSYVDFKAIVRKREHIGTWYSRIQQVYGISTENEKKGFHLELPAYAHFMRMDQQTLEELKTSGVTHILTYREHMLDLEIIAENYAYKVYKLK